MESLIENNWTVHFWKYIVILIVNVMISSVSPKWVNVSIFENRPHLISQSEQYMTMPSQSESSTAFKSICFNNGSNQHIEGGGQFSCYRNLNINERT